MYPQQPTTVWNSWRMRLTEISEMTSGLLFPVIQHTTAFMKGNKKNKSRLKIDCYLFFLCSKVVPKQQLTPYILSQQPLKGMKHRQLSLRFSSPHMTVFATPLTWPLYSAAFHIVMKTYSSRKFTIRDTCPWFILGKSMNSSRSTCKIFVLRPFLYTSYNKDSK